MQAPAEQGLDIALLPGQRPGFVHILLHSRVTLEIPVYILLGLAAAQVQLLRQAEGRHAVYEAEVDGFGLAPLVPAHLVQADLEHLRRGRPVHVQAILERLKQPLVPGQVRHDTQFDLGIIGRHDAVTVGGDERLANAPAFLRADRDVLQVGVRGGQPAGGGHRLVVGGVNPTGAGIDHLRQLVCVGGLELAQAAVLQQQLRQRVVQGQFRQHVLRGGGRPGWCLLDDRELQLLEQDLSQLFGGAEIELLPGQFVCPALQLLQALPQLATLGQQ